MTKESKQIDYETLIDCAGFDGLSQTIGAIVMINIIIIHNYDDKTSSPYYIWGNPTLRSFPSLP